MVVLSIKINSIHHKLRYRILIYLSSISLLSSLRFFIPLISLYSSRSVFDINYILKAESLCHKSIH